MFPVGVFIFTDPFKLGVFFGRSGRISPRGVLDSFLLFRLSLLRVAA